MGENGIATKAKEAKTEVKAAIEEYQVADNGVGKEEGTNR